MDSLKQLAIDVNTRSVRLLSGGEICLAQWTIRFLPAEPDRLPAGTLAKTYTTKPLVQVDGEPLFGELAIVRWLQKDGWDGVWVDTYHSRGRRKFFWQGMPHKTEPYDLSSIPRVWKTYNRIVEHNGGRAAGFFDVLAWRGDRLLFAEYKGKGDKPNKNERAWIDAAVRAGVLTRDMLYVRNP